MKNLIQRHKNSAIRTNKRLCCAIFLLCVFLPGFVHAGFSFRKGQKLNVLIQKEEQQVVKTALEILAKDHAHVFGAGLEQNGKKSNVFVGTLGLKSAAEKLAGKKDAETLSKMREGFLIRVSADKLIVLGSDKRGTAYGILELSRLMGVSPWEWWADSPAEPKNELTLQNDFRVLQAPSVKHRGIFINDEDWGLMPWSSMTYEPSDIKGRIGPKTHERIFELLLRLRANTFWPAMHDCSVAFYLTPGNKEMADKYGIIIGTSHCEPMMRNTNAEWKTGGTGEYDVVNNRSNVLKFWEERTREVAGSDNIYTLGIRGVHDGKMQGANTLQEQKDAIGMVLDEQRKMIKRLVNPNVEKVPQVFIPYKEVLDVYNMGLKLPDDVTIMWTDDNYGYIRHFPDSAEQARKGGNGIYTHVSYWGRPHDYLWLATTHPALIYTQMKLAYDKGAKDIWILNVGDIKPAEYLTELFLDMAWDIAGIEGNREGLDAHLLRWLTREFGAKPAAEMLPVMNEYYRLAYIRKPEFMGNTRTEEKDPAYKIVSDLPWSLETIRQRLAAYKAIVAKTQEIAGNIPHEKRDAWFQLVEYPVKASAAMNVKHLQAQLARHGMGEWATSDAAHDEIVALTQHYNTLANSKWRLMMDYRPRRLAVFDRVAQTKATNELVRDKKPMYTFNGEEYSGLIGQKPVAHGLGYERKAVSLAPNTTLQYQFETAGNDSIQITVALVPNHSVNGKHIRYAIAIDNEQPRVVEYRTFDRSEEWKVNVLTNQAIRTTVHRPKTAGKHVIKITAVDEGVMVDQVRVF